MLMPSPHVLVQEVQEALENCMSVSEIINTVDMAVYSLRHLSTDTYDTFGLVTGMLWSGAGNGTMSRQCRANVKQKGTQQTV
jgi:hypothetical protein